LRTGNGNNNNKTERDRETETERRRAAPKREVTKQEKDTLRCKDAIAT
jgi:hypothetical protein